MREGYKLVLEDRFWNVVIRVYRKVEPEPPYLPELDDYVVVPA